MDLKSRIRATERRIQCRRDSIASAMGSLAKSAREKVISPASLITAGLVGVAMHRSERLNGLRILAIIQSANTGLRLLLTANSKISNSAS